jgi:hypothetical protein
MYLCMSDRVSGKCVRALLLNCFVFTYTGAKNIGLVGKKKKKKKIKGHWYVFGFDCNVG